MIRLSLITIFAFSLTFSACSDANHPPTTDRPTNGGQLPPQPIDSTCLYTVDSIDGNIMVKEFSDSFHDQRLTKSFWAPACFVIYLADSVFKKNGDDFDGARFLSGYNNKKSTLIMVPTSKVLNPTFEYQHTDRWDKKIEACATSEFLINKTEADANRQTRPFGILLRGEDDPYDRNSATNKLLTAGIWVDKCVFENLARELKNAPAKLDGIVFLAAAYTPRVRAWEYSGAIDRDHQSTFVIIPTDAPNHTPNWSVINKKPIGGYNHSQLCPQICN